MQEIYVQKVCFSLLRRRDFSKVFLWSCELLGKNMKMINTDQRKNREVAKSHMGREMNHSPEGKDFV